MAQVKVRHGAVTWQYYDRVSKRECTNTAFRGMVIDMPQEEIDRLKPLGAVVDVGQELPLGGTLSPIPSTASDEELIAWASVANRDEIIAEIQRVPALGDRILAAFEIVQQKLAEQNELLGGLAPEIEAAKSGAEKQAEKEAEARAKAATEAAAASEAAAAELIAAQTEGNGVGNIPAPNGDGAIANGTNQIPGDSADGGGSQEDEPEDPDEIVKKNVHDVGEYLSNHPDQAQEILEAENRRAANATEDREKSPRVGVLRAVEVAAAHAAA